MNIRFIDPPPQEEEDIFKEIDGPNEFDGQFNTLLNNAQQNLNRENAQSNEVE